MLLERARAWLEPDQQALDLDVTPQIPVEKPLPTGQKALLDPAEKPARIDEPGRTESTGSVLLRQVMTDVYEQLGFGIVGYEVFRDLVIARIVEPGSKLDAGRVLQDLGADPPSYATIKRHLKQVITGEYRDKIAEQCFAHAAETGGLSLLLYDVTTLLCRRRHNKVYADVTVMPMSGRVAQVSL
nr:hypothetical protein [Rhodococcus sp. JVH1]